MSEEENAQYKMACFVCGKEKNLCMMSHKNEAGRIVGWVFACMACMRIIQGKLLDIKLKEEKS